MTLPRGKARRRRRAWPYHATRALLWMVGGALFLLLADQYQRLRSSLAKRQLHTLAESCGQEACKRRDGAGAERRRASLSSEPAAQGSRKFVWAYPGDR